MDGEKSAAEAFWLKQLYIFPYAVLFCLTPDLQFAELETVMN